MSRRAARDAAAPTTWLIRTVAGLGLLGLAAAGCGIPTDHSPRLLDRRELPAALTGATTTTGLDGSGRLMPLQLYLVRTTPDSQVLQPVAAKVPEKATIVSQAEAVLVALIAEQPSTTKATANLTNALPSNLRILHTSLDGNVLDLNISHLDLSVVSLQQKLAFAQMVFTVTELNGIAAVKFSIVGQAAQVPLDSGISPAGAAIVRADYRQLIAGH